MKNHKILRNTFISIGFLLAFTQLLTAGAMHRVLNSSERPLTPSQPIYVTFDVPDGINGVYGQAINSAGVIAGTYLDENFLLHGFVRAQDGAVLAFDAPGGAITQIGGSSLFAPGAINPAGAITG